MTSTIPAYVIDAKPRTIKTTADGEGAYVEPVTTEALKMQRDRLAQRLSIRGSRDKSFVTISDAFDAQIAIADRLGTLSANLDIAETRTLFTRYQAALMFRTDAALENSSTLATSLAKAFDLDGDLPSGGLTRGQRLHFGELLLAAELEAESPSTTDVMMKFDALVLVGRAAKGQEIDF